MELIINKPDIPGGIKLVEFKETKEQHDKVPCVRLYCTMHNEAYSLQIRGTTHMGDSSLRTDKKQRNLIATIDLNWDDLKKIAAYVMAIQKEMIEGHYDELRSEPEPKTPA